MLDGFVNPLLAFGALLAAVPLVIHLLNRRRHQPLQFAAMRFVMAAYKKTRRRAQMENLLLLLLRMAAIALLAFALSRPFIGGDSPLSALTETRRDVVLVLDGSASTGYRDAVRSVHDEIVERARAILGELDSARGDRARLIWAADHPRLLSWRSPEEALSILGTIGEPTDAGFDLAATLAEAARFAEEDAAGTGESALEIRVLSDLQRRSFAPGAAGAAGAGAGAELDELDELGTPDGAGADPASKRHAALVEQLDRLAAVGVTAYVEDLGPAATVPPNLTVADVRPLGPVLGPGTPTEIGVTVVNQGTTTQSQVRVALSVDGERRPSQVVDVPGRGRAQAVFPVAFAQSGHHLLEAELPGDRLEIDDARTHVVFVPPTLRVCLVDGAPAGDIDADEVGLLAAVLDPLDDSIGGPSRFTPFETRVVTPDALGSGEIDLAQQDVIWLANVQSLAHGTVEKLEERIAAGAALVISLGDRVDRASYNSRLWSADGTGLLPAELGQRVSVARREGYYRVSDFDATHPALAFFEDDRWRLLLTEVPIYEFVAADPQEDAHVLARLDDEASSPLLVERAYDRGRVILLTTTIDPDWARLAESPNTLVPLAHELLRYAGRPPTPPRNAPVGHPLAAEVEAFPRNATLVGPDGARRSLDGEPQELAAGLWSLPPIASADRAGPWRVEMDGTPPVLFGVQLDAREGDLERVGSAELEFHPALRILGARESRGSDDPEDDPLRGELWRAFALACLLALALESLWAAWLGYKRRTA